MSVMLSVEAAPSSAYVPRCVKRQFFVPNDNSQSTVAWHHVPAKNPLPALNVYVAVPLASSQDLEFAELVARSSQHLLDPS